MAREEIRTRAERLRDVALNTALVTAAVLAIGLLGSSLFRALVPGRHAAPARPTASASAGLAAPEIGAGLEGEPREGAPKSGSEIRVQVLNGCGVPGAGAGMASVLRQAGGLDVIEIANADQFDFESSLVLDRTGDSAPAKRVAKILNGAPVLRQRRADAQSDVTVIVGYDRGRWLTPLPSGGGR